MTLEALLSSETTIPVSNRVAVLAEALRSRGNAACILFYGSSLWKAEDNETLYDFYVLVDRYRDFDARGTLAVLGSLLPPNVYYLEVPSEGYTLRCKFAVMRRDQFRRGAEGRALTPQIWARFAQPCRIVYARDETVRAETILDLCNAVLIFHRRARALVGRGASPEKLWLAGFTATYGAELRSERKDRTQLLFAANRIAFEARTALAMPDNIAQPLHLSRANENYPKNARVPAIDEGDFHLRRRGGLRAVEDRTAKRRQVASQRAAAPPSFAVRVAAGMGGV